MPAHSNKRKAIELVDGDIKENFKRLATALEDCMEQLKSSDERFDERFKKLEDWKYSFDQSIEAIVNAPDSEGEEDLSDDEESVVDPSDTWTLNFMQLREYRMMHGDCKVPFNYKENKTLGYWVATQRKSYSDYKKNKPERIIKLDSLGFYWGKKFPPPKTWDEMYEELKTFKEKMGHCNVPFNATNPSPLAKWMAYQRKEYKRWKKGEVSILTLDQIGKLRDIGMKMKGPKL